jgi:hypothetical protein
MKIATIFFNSPETRRRYMDALRERMYAAGFEPIYATEWLRTWFPSKKLTGIVTGTDDAERAADVALEVRGVMVKMREEP